jgi:hypothetical protein
MYFIKKFKTIALILSMLILLQGCTVYKSASVSLEQAALEENKVRLETKSGEKLKFIRIGVENGNYYGVKKVKGDKALNYKTVPLETNYIKNVKLKDETLSTILTIVTPIVFILGWAMSAFAVY